jgi:hypothetical protein
VGDVKRHTLLQFVGLVSFFVVTATAFVLSGSFGGSYTLGLIFGFGIGLAVAIFQYGMVVETDAKSRGYPTSVARKIDQVFE